MTLRILQISDCHLSPEPAGLFRGIDPLLHLQAVTADAQRRFAPVDLLLLTGDLTHHAEPGAYRRLLHSVEGLAHRRHWLPGNHDVAASMQAVEALEPTLGCKQIDTPHWRILLLDSTHAPDGRGGGSLAPAELDWLQQQLNDAGQRWVFIVLHHNPVALGSAWQDAIMLGNAAAFWARVEACPQVRGIAFGHVHQQQLLLRGQVQLFAAPSTAVQFEAGCADFKLESDPALARPGYRYYELADDGHIEAQLCRIKVPDCVG
ncbi:metallophosphoesterase [Marinobacterium rhizophilum]|uniref:Metallophosphoesterase n=1 Tax=Marinobacterium rhizophilum TaxID=420402 RepID=A0ABY5HDE7_9GAMM|nr:metallophosphoesterase [Marinobacterium rhizophilum]UTW10363.1 metallophosphoesterase [Marinobacterium rhizophilum]